MVYTYLHLRLFLGFFTELKSFLLFNLAGFSSYIFYRIRKFFHKLQKYKSYVTKHTPTSTTFNGAYSKKEGNYNFLVIKLIIMLFINLIFINIILINLILIRSTLLTLFFYYLYIYLHIFIYLKLTLKNFFLYLDQFF